MDFPPEQLCGCPVDTELAPGRTFLAIGAGGRGVVLKKLDAECLLADGLHPSIRDRLGRVREVAHVGVANLHGVAREDKDAYLIWEYLEGEPFDRYASDGARSPREVAAAARELALALDTLHLQGIVHGALSGGNAIVSRSGAVRLTHVSPLLYTEPSVDAQAFLALLDSVLERRQEQNSPLGRLVADARLQELSLRQIGTRLAALIESRAPVAGPAAVPPEPDAPRRRNLVAATLVALVGLAIAYGAWVAAESGGSLLQRSPHLPQLSRH